MHDATGNGWKPRALRFRVRAQFLLGVEGDRSEADDIMEMDGAMRLHTQHYGAGHPLVILHGLFGSLLNWNSISKLLGAHYRVVAVDQRNHGSSPHTPDMSYPAMADDLLELFEAEQLGSAHVLGHSMGGKTAMQFALTYPDRVDRLIVVDIAPRAYAPHHDDIFAAMYALDLRQSPNRSELDQALAQHIHDRAVRQFLLTNVVRDDAGGFRWKINLDALRDNYRALVGGVGTRGRFDKPTLFVRGEKSDYIQSSDEPQIRALFPQATIRTIEGAGHWVHAEAPTEFAQVVLEFLQQSRS